MIVTRFRAKQPPKFKSVGPNKGNQLSPSPEDSFKSGEPKSHVAQWALGAVVAAGVGALGYFAGSTSSTAATLAGVATGAITGGTTLGVAGMFADLSGGMMSSSNYAKPAWIAGGLLGAAGGGLVSAYCASPLAGAVMAATSGIAGGLVAVALANEKLG